MNRLKAAVLLLPLASALLTGCMGPLHKAAMTNDASAVRAQLAAGAPVNQSAGAGKLTPLHYAAAADAFEAARVLLDGGADVFARSIYGTPREWALSQRHDKVANLIAAYERQQLGQMAEMPARAAAPAAAAPAASAPDADSPRHHAPPRPDDFALVVGIEKYSRLPEARFAENDADAMKRHLLALGYPERNIVLLKGGQATRGAISGYVEEWLPRNAKPGSSVFVYFSGHGSPDPKTGDAYLVPWDGDAMFLKSTAYPLKSLYASLGKLKSKRVLVALDSCFSGAGGRSVLAEGARPLVARVDEAAAPAGVTVLSAASGDEITATIQDQRHGAFTYHLLQALNNGKLTARSAYEELKPRVQDEARRQNREQTPLLMGDEAPF